MSGPPDFVFNCHRCGACCHVGHGRVWIEPEEIGALAAACGSAPAAFAARHVVAAEGRLSLREKPDGCCALLEDGNRCTVYEARPAQCRSFPFWPDLLAGGLALERAAGYCPGIQRIPEPELAAAVLPRARAILRRSAASLAAGPSPVAAGGERWGSSLEADLTISSIAGSGLTISGLTPGHDVGAAAADAARRELEDLAAATGYPWSVGPWQRMLAERAAGWAQLRGGPPRLAEAG